MGKACPRPSKNVRKPAFRRYLLALHHLVEPNLTAAPSIQCHTSLSFRNWLTGLQILGTRMTVELTVEAKPASGTLRWS
jgi:hypothetical protein